MVTFQNTEKRRSKKTEELIRQFEVTNRQHVEEGLQKAGALVAAEETLNEIEEILNSIEFRKLSMKLR